MRLRGISLHMLEEAVYSSCFDGVEYISSLREIVKVTYKGEVGYDEVERLVDECIVAERNLSFSFEEYAAIPHLTQPTGTATRCGWFRSVNGVFFGADRRKVNLIFCAFGDSMHLPPIMASACEILRRPNFIQHVKEQAVSDDRFRRVVYEALKEVITVPQWNAELINDQDDYYFYRECDIINRRGLHARASAKLCKFARDFDCDMRLGWRFYTFEDAISRISPGATLESLGAPQVHDRFVGWKLGSYFWLQKEGDVFFLSVNCRDIMGLMSLVAGPGTRLWLRTSGNEAREGLEVVSHLIENRFEED